jgi:hypothetical protein
MSLKEQDPARLRLKKLTQIKVELKAKLEVEARRPQGERPSLLSLLRARWGLLQIAETFIK